MDYCETELSNIGYWYVPLNILKPVQIIYFYFSYINIYSINITELQHKWIYFIAMFGLNNLIITMKFLFAFQLKGIRY